MNPNISNSENKIYCADPCVMFDPISKSYFCYATYDDEHLHFEILESIDLINWKKVGFALNDLDKNNWGSSWFWAPECYYNPYNNYYYLLYSAKVLPNLVGKYFGDENYEECCRIGVAVSKSPKGPFINITNRPLDYHPYDPNYTNVDLKYKDIFKLHADHTNKLPKFKGEYLSTIDVNLFFDDDNRIYLYFSRCCYHNAVFDVKLNKYIEESNICAVELDRDWWISPTPIMPTIKKEYIHVQSNNRQDKFVSIISYKNDPQEWENGHINDYELSNGVKHNRRWSEGSTTFYRFIDGQKIYFITYSCNNYENEMYGVGVAYSISPLGPYIKYSKNPIISKNNKLGIVSTGHGSIIEKEDELFYLHHGRNNPFENRSLFLTRISNFTPESITVEDPIPCTLIE